MTDSSILFRKANSTFPPICHLSVVETLFSQCTSADVTHQVTWPVKMVRDKICVTCHQTANKRSNFVHRSCYFILVGKSLNLRNVPFFGEKLKQLDLVLSDLSSRWGSKCWWVRSVQVWWREDEPPLCVRGVYYSQLPAAQVAAGCWVSADSEVPGSCR